MTAPDSPLTVLYPAGSFYPAQTGGPDNTVYWVAKAIARHGHRPVIASADAGLPDDVPRGEWLSTDHGEKIFSREAIHYLPLKTVARARARLGDADVVHVNMLSYPAAWLTVMANAAGPRKPVLWSMRGELDPPMLLRSPRKKRAILSLVRRLMGRLPITFHSTCDAETAYVRDNFGRGAAVAQIPNYLELPERVAADEAGAPYLLFVGRIDPKKGIDRLLRALTLSSSFRREGWRLKVVGDHDNAYGREMVALAGELGVAAQVDFLGHRQGAAKEQLLASARCLVMPSHTENFGIVVTEALAQATPAIASTGTPWSQLPERGAGYWVDNAPEDLAAALDDVIALTPAEASAMSAAALRLARERFDIHAHAGEWVDTYRSLLR